MLRLLPVDNYQFHQVMINSVIQRVYHGVYSTLRVRKLRNAALLSRHFRYLILLLRQRYLGRKKHSA